MFHLVVTMSSASILVAGVVMPTPAMAQTNAPKRPAETVTDRDLTCEVSGSSFVLGPNDFKALRDVEITPGAFKALPPGSKKKIQICTTRYVSRLMAVGKATCSDVKVGLFSPILLTDEELAFLNKFNSGCLADVILEHKDKLLPGR